MGRWLRDQLRARRVDALFTAMGRMNAVDGPAVVSPEEVAQEIAAMRVELSANNAKADPVVSGDEPLLGDMNAKGKT